MNYSDIRKLSVDEYNSLLDSLIAGLEVIDKIDIHLFPVDGNGWYKTEIMTVNGQRLQTVGPVKAGNCQATALAEARNTRANYDALECFQGIQTEYI